MAESKQEQLIAPGVADVSEHRLTRPELVRVLSLHFQFKLLTWVVVHEDLRSRSGL